MIVPLSPPNHEARLKLRFGGIAFATSVALTPEDDFHLGAEDGIEGEVAAIEFVVGRAGFGAIA